MVEHGPESRYSRRKEPTGDHTPGFEDTHPVYPEFKDTVPLRPDAPQAPSTDDLIRDLKGERDRLFEARREGDSSAQNMKDILRIENLLWGENGLEKFDAEEEPPSESGKAETFVDKDLFNDEPDGTEDWRARWKGKLREAVSKVTTATKEGVQTLSERSERLSRYLHDRSREIDAQTEKMGKLEVYFRKLGEQYNKLGFKSKLALGASLGLGAAAFSTVSVPIALSFTAGLAAQRAAGMASVFLRSEKQFQSRQAGGLLARKEKAMLDAVMYTAVMGYAIKEAVDYASESSAGHAVQDWLRHHYPFGDTPLFGGRVAEAPSATGMEPAASAAGEASPPAAAASAATGEAQPPVPEPAAPTKIPDVSVGATKGYGYEYMAKRLWEQLQEKGLDPSAFTEGSDIRRLLEADASSIDKVVHQIAADPDHGAFGPDGSSMVISPDARMTIGEDGQLRLSSISVAEEVQTPEQSTDSSSVRAEFTVPSEEPHLYTNPDAKQIFVYGGSSDEQGALIRSYLEKNPHTVVLSADMSGQHRVAWHLDESGKLAASAPLQSNGFLGLFSRLLPPPGPEDFTNRVA